MAKYKYLAPAAFALVMLVLLVIPMPGDAREIRSAGDLAHTPMFALFASLLFQLLRHRRPSSTVANALLTVAIIAGFAVGTEVLQSFVHRYPSLQDVAADILGGTGGILLTLGLTAPSRRRRNVYLATASVCFLAGMAEPLSILADSAIQRAEMPRVASFEQPLELSRWSNWDCHIERTAEHATHGSRSLRVDLQPGRYPGVILYNPLPDWSGYRECLADIYLAGDKPLELTVKLQDKKHNWQYHDRFHQTVRLSPGPNTIRIDLQQVRLAPRDRDMDLHRMAALSLFAVNLDHPRTFYLDHIRLQ